MQVWGGGAPPAPPLLGGEPYHAREVQDSLNTAQDSPGRPGQPRHDRDWPNTVRDRPKIARDRSKTAPRQAQETHKREAQDTSIKNFRFRTEVATANKEIQETRNSWPLPRQIQDSPRQLRLVLCFGKTLLSDSLRENIQRSDFWLYHIKFCYDCLLCYCII